MCYVVLSSGPRMQGKSGLPDNATACDIITMAMLSEGADDDENDGETKTRAANMDVLPPVRRRRNERRMTRPPMSMHCITGILARQMPLERTGCTASKRRTATLASLK